MEFYAQIWTVLDTILTVASAVSVAVVLLQINLLLPTFLGELPSSGPSRDLWKLYDKYPNSFAASFLLGLLGAIYLLIKYL